MARAVEVWREACNDAELAGEASAGDPLSAVENEAAGSAVTVLPAELGLRPDVVPGGSITAYSHRDLVALARWIMSDTLLRTDDDLHREMQRELGFSRGGSRIKPALQSHRGRWSGEMSPPNGQESIPGASFATAREGGQGSNPGPAHASSEAWDAALSPLRLGRRLSPFISRMWTWWVVRFAAGPALSTLPCSSRHRSSRTTRVSALLTGPCPAPGEPQFSAPGGADDQTGCAQGEGQGHHEGEHDRLRLDAAQLQVGNPYGRDKCQQAQPDYSRIDGYSSRFPISHNSSPVSGHACCRCGLPLPSVGLPALSSGDRTGACIDRLVRPAALEAAVHLCRISRVRMWDRAACARACWLGRHSLP